MVEVRVVISAAIFFFAAVAAHVDRREVTAVLGEDLFNLHWLSPTMSRKRRKGAWGVYFVLAPSLPSFSISPSMASFASFRPIPVLARIALIAGIFPSA